MNVVFGVVDATSSAPPSRTSILPSCQIARAPSTTRPGTSASAVVVVAQVAPTVVSAVALHDAGKVAVKSVMVAASTGVEPLYLSIRRIDIAAWSSPV
jgi:hypothetical protein